MTRCYNDSGAQWQTQFFRPVGGFAEAGTQNIEILACLYFSSQSMIM